MRLQRVGTRRVGNRTYYKHVVTLPEETLRALGWRPGIELAIRIRRGELVLRSAGNEAPSETRSDAIESGYAEFCEAIRREVAKHPIGRTWSQIRDALQLPQKVPNNRWVRQMERDIGLLRVKSQGETVWRLEKR